jgi:multidrug efflux pump subunit AcrB
MSTFAKVALLVGSALLVAIVAVCAVKFPAFGAWLSAHRGTLPLIGVIALAVVLLGFLINRYNLIWRTHDAFNVQFEKLRRFYGGVLVWALDHRGFVVGAFSVFVLATFALTAIIGHDFFPSVDAGQMRLHVRAPAGTRIEQTRQYFAQVQSEIRKIIPKNELGVVLDNIGIPNSAINTSLSDGSMMSPADGEIMMALKEGHAPTERYMKTLRRELPRKFPNLTFFFAPSDIVTQVLNFGLQAPIDIQVTGPAKNAKGNLEVAQAIHNDVRKLAGVVDVRMQQVPRTPDIRVNVDRTLASQLGVSQRDVASSLLVSLSSSNQTAPNFWLNPENGVQYSIFVQTPQYRMDSINALENTTVLPAGGSNTPDDAQLLGNLAQTVRGTSPTNVTHYNIAPSYDVLLGVQGLDLGRAADSVNQLVAKYEKQLPRGSKIAVRGQVESMSSSFQGLALGLVFAVLLVYLLMVVNFQSWMDPLIILMALPGAAAWILWILFATGTTISVPALMGAIMAVGVATANSILMITFANDQRKEFGMNARDAALTAGLTRLRPVIMTALAMIIGMLPMSLGLGEGGEQNAPLGRAVIGGLTCATFATLIFVPVVYSLLRRNAPVTQVEEELR